jgi:STE24 endopeptidase
VKGGVLGLVFGSAAVALVFWFLLKYPDFWWLAVWGLMLVVTILITLITPIFLVPIFFKTRPLDDQDLKSRLEKLAQKSRAKVKGIYTLDFSRKTTAANAALMGICRTRRIVISDTLIRQYTALK